MVIVNGTFCANLVLLSRCNVKICRWFFFVWVIGGPHPPSGGRGTVIVVLLSKARGGDELRVGLSVSNVHSHRRTTSDLRNERTSNVNPIPKIYKHGELLRWIELMIFI